MDISKKSYEWYAVPPYHNEGWQIKNEEGGHVATFEDKRECLEVVSAIQKQNEDHGNFIIEQKVVGTGTFNFMTEHGSFEEAKEHYDYAIESGFSKDEIRLVKVIKDGSVN